MNNKFLNLFILFFTISLKSADKLEQAYKEVWHYALHDNYKKAFEISQTPGFDINKLLVGKSHMLFHAIRIGDINLINFLMSFKVVLNIVEGETGDTPLIVAAKEIFAERHKSLDIIAYLLTFDFDKLKKNKEYKTYLDYLTGEQLHKIDLIIKEKKGFNKRKRGIKKSSKKNDLVDDDKEDDKRFVFHANELFFFPEKRISNYVLCKKCNCYVQDYHFLVNHKKLHEENKKLSEKFVCNLCSPEPCNFKSISSLNEHIKSVHESLFLLWQKYISNHPRKDEFPDADLTPLKHSLSDRSSSPLPIASTLASSTILPTASTLPSSTPPIGIPLKTASPFPTSSPIPTSELLTINRLTPSPLPASPLSKTGVLLPIGSPIQTKSPLLTTEAESKVNQLSTTSSSSVNSLGISSGVSSSKAEKREMPTKVFPFMYVERDIESSDDDIDVYPIVRKIFWPHEHELFEGRNYEQCPVCKCFMSEGIYRNHQVVHNNNKHKCKICEKMSIPWAYKRMDSLDSHIISMHCKKEDVNKKGHKRKKPKVEIPASITVNLSYQSPKVVSSLPSPLPPSAACSSSSSAKSSENTSPQKYTAAFNSPLPSSGLPLSTNSSPSSLTFLPTSKATPTPSAPSTSPLVSKDSICSLTTTSTLPSITLAVVNSNLNAQTSGSLISESANSSPIAKKSSLSSSVVEIPSLESATLNPDNPPLKGKGDITNEVFAELDDLGIMPKDGEIAEVLHQYDYPNIYLMYGDQKVGVGAQNEEDNAKKTSNTTLNVSVTINDNYFSDF